MTLETITHCGTTWLVGIDGRSLFKEPSACSGEFGGAHYIGFSNDQLAAAPPVSKTSPCGKCGATVQVKVNRSEGGESAK